MAVKHLSLRIEEEHLAKLRVIAQREWRSTNMQVVWWIRECIAAYESEHGLIEAPQKP